MLTLYFTHYRRIAFIKYKLIGYNKFLSSTDKTNIWVGKLYRYTMVIL